MAENVSTKSPCSLYKQGLRVFVNNLYYNFSSCKKFNYVQCLPPMIMADIYSQMSASTDLRLMLYDQLSDFEGLVRILKIGSARQKMFRCFSDLMSNGLNLAAEVAYNIRNKHCFGYYDTYTERHKYLEKIDGHIRIASFLAEAGRLEESITILSTVSAQLNLLEHDYTTLILQIDCFQRLLHSQAGFSCFKEADKTFSQTDVLIAKVGLENIPLSLLASWYIKVSVLNFGKSDYNRSYEWSLKALKMLNEHTPKKITIDVLRQAGKSCVVKRHYKKANMLISQAVKMARNTFGKHHQKYADTLLDYGFFLLNVDSIAHSVNVYKEALDIRRYIFRDRNLQVATAHEDLSYALYVCEYSSGQFQNAQNHIEQAIDILKELVPTNHLLIASAKRVKALILEEIALDNITMENKDYKDLLVESENLHQTALELSLDAFGEINVQTAKHYGNLGRLYQSMKRYKDSEKMHKRAIKIKSDLLGPYDYEVGLSIGHLASLYNYHMEKHREAEKLYLRSISISLRLFGKSYSGLEYDYRGLCYVYENVNEIHKYIEYVDILDTWKALREECIEGNKTLYELKGDSTLEDIKEQFFDMCTNESPINN